MRFNQVIIVFTILSLPSICHAIKQMTDTEIKEEIIKGSITDFQGDCPCPYTKDQTGKECGNTSAYFTYQPVNRPSCYPDDITQNQIYEYRAKYNIPQLHDLSKPLNDEDAR